EPWLRAPSGQTGQQATSTLSASAIASASRVELLTMQAETAVVRVMLMGGEGQPATRQMQAYEQTQVGWERVALTPALMGSAQRLETDLFVFEYRQFDAD